MHESVQITNKTFYVPDECGSSPRVDDQNLIYGKQLATGDLTDSQYVLL